MAVKVTRTFTATQRGVGKPDYTKEIYAGRERSGIALEYNQTFRVFAANWSTGDALYPFVIPNPVAAGASVHLRDSDTLALMPVIIPAGYTLTVISVGYSVTEDLIMYAYIDALTLGISINLGVLGGGLSVYENKLREVSTAWYDPTALLPHTLDIIAYNQGGGLLYGGIGILCIQEAIGTPPLPTTKECFCPHCDYKQTVPITTSVIVCDQCGKTYMVTVFSSLRRL